MIAWQQVQPGAVYTLAQVAELFARSKCTIRQWVQRGKLRTVGPGHFRFLGADLLRLGGPAVSSLRFGIPESPVQRKKRASQAAAEVLRNLQQRAQCLPGVN